MDCRPSILLILLGALNASCLAQGKFSAGAKVGAGGSLFPLHATLDAKDSVDNVYAGTTLTTGIFVNYMIGGRMGIESGVCLSHYSYYRNEEKFWRTRIWKGAATMEMVNYQIPLLILYRYDIPSNPFKDITFAGGTSIDWLAEPMLKSTGPMWLKNIFGGIRLGKERMKGGRFEYGLEFQYSLNRFVFKGTNYNKLDYKLNSRLGLLSLNLYYFFYGRAIGRLSET
jgi:hypothetical protein